MVKRPVDLLSFGLKASLAILARDSPKPDTTQPDPQVDLVLETSNFCTDPSDEESESESELELEELLEPDEELSDGMLFAQRERKKI